MFINGVRATTTTGYYCPFEHARPHSFNGRESSGSQIDVWVSRVHGRSDQMNPQRGPSGLTWCGPRRGAARGR